MEPQNGPDFPDTTVLYSFEEAFDLERSFLFCHGFFPLCLAVLLSDSYLFQGAGSLFENIACEEARYMLQRVSHLCSCGGRAMASYELKPGVGRP